MRIISIIVPVYNVEKELQRCVESLITQTYKNIEIILVDDGSTDACGKICDNYLNKDKRIKVIHQINLGVSAARNNGLRSANGEYILFVDADDYIEPDSCEKFMNVVSNSDTDLVVANAKIVLGNTCKLITHNSLKENTVYSGREYLINTISNMESEVVSWLFLYKKKFLIDHCIYFREGIKHEDMEIYFRIFLRELKISYMDYPFYNYIIRNGSITTTRDDKRINVMIDIYNSWKNNFDGITDHILQKKLYGFLCKCYIHTYKTFNMKEKNLVDGVNASFLFRYGLNIKEKIKVFWYLLN